MVLQQPVTIEPAFERLPPQSLEAEQAILGALLVDTTAVNRVVETVKPSHLYRNAHRLIYQASLDLFDKGEPVDIITVSELLKDRGVLEDAGGRSYINDLALSVVTTDNVSYYAEIVRDKALLRDLITVGTQVVETAYELEDAEAAIDQAQQAIFQVAQQGTRDALISIQDILPVTFEQIEERHANKGSLMGVSSGFYDLDNYTSGFQRSDLIILAARPSMGKTAFCLNIVNHVALREQKPVLVFSLEMSKEAVVQRMLCSEAEIDAQRIRTGEITEQDFQKLAVAMGRLGDAPIYVDDSPGMSVMEMRAKARKLILEQRKELGLIVIDYLQLMEGRSGGKGGMENRTLEIAAISRGLKGLARELKVPVMALSQLSRAVESRTDKKPMLSDLRESGSIEQDADLVMFIYRDEYYNPETDRPGMADILIAKQRNGPVGNIQLIFRNNITKFMNPAEKKVRIF
ncbi:MAG: replicative DNA helicase [Candidatus Melainabacteria bacterium]|nr:replicative DNA helicase [Candidatus Melainabacteria bacterium]